MKLSLTLPIPINSTVLLAGYQTITLELSYNGMIPKYMCFKAETTTPINLAPTQWQQECPLYITTFAGYEPIEKIGEAMRHVLDALKFDEELTTYTMEAIDNFTKIVNARLVK